MNKQAVKEMAAMDAGKGPLSSKELQLMNAYWRACNYLSVGMIYLQDNPLLKEALKTEHVKHRLLGHWGASPALSFVWVHLNRLIRQDDLDVIFVAGPGHGAPGVLGPAYLEGTYSEIYPDKSEDAEGMRKFFKQFSFPGHIGSHVTPNRALSTKEVNSAIACRTRMAWRSTIGECRLNCICIKNFVTWCLGRSNCRWVLGMHEQHRQPIQRNQWRIPAWNDRERGINRDDAGEEVGGCARHREGHDGPLFVADEKGQCRVGG